LLQSFFKKGKNLEIFYTKKIVEAAHKN